MTSHSEPPARDDLAREREAATREILQVISQSRDDETPVFEAILKRAARLCQAPQAGLIMPNEAGTHVKYIASWGPPSKYFRVGVSEWPIDDPIAVTTAIRECRVVNIPDIVDDELTRRGHPTRLEIIEKEGIRSILAVPLIRDGTAIGCLDIYRLEVKPFTGDEVTLVETFAAQAVIAIENVRQFRELQSRLEREAATGEILNVISRSRDDEQPVFEAILKNALALCDAPLGAVFQLDEDGAHFRARAHKGVDGEWLDDMQNNPPPAHPEKSMIAEAAFNRRVVQVEDLRDTDLYRDGEPSRVAAVDVAGMRTTVTVPMLSGEDCAGVICLYRREVKPFSPDQIALAETFAAQAVIAIENVRQFRELQTRLEREEATREILQVISRSRDDEGPVFDAILENAARLCNSTMARLHLLNEQGTHHLLAAHWGEAMHTLEIGEAWSMDAPRAIPRSIREARTIQTKDMADTDLYRSGDPVIVRMVDEEGLRTGLRVPLIKGDRAFGCIALSRREVRPFGEDEIALVETFAAQAVIAIENVRQFRELRTRLAREAATREILEVISRSRDDEGPVFDAILENAARLCKSTMARLHLLTDDGARHRLAAHWGEDLRTLELGETWPMNERYHIPRTISEARMIHTEDMAQIDLYREGDPVFRRLVDEEGLRTRLTVPLLHGDRAFGCIALSRREVRPFRDEDVELVKTFAAQAVIAIDGVRQFRELQTRLEREAATREILQVISRSRADTGPVFEAILENARRLCKAPMAMLSIANEERTRVTVPAWLGAREAFAKALEDFDHAIDAPFIAVRPIADGRVIHMADVTEDDLYRDRHPTRVLLADVEGVRTILAVPMISNGISIGAIILYRREVQPFDDGQIELVKTFADQAAIAVENVRQFNALEARTEELHELNANLEGRVEAQVGEIERMGRLKRFLSPAVADAVVSSGNDKLLSSHRALIAVLFCDIRGFTAFCETAEPEETIEVLQLYHEEMGRLIRAHGGGVDTRAGDGIMVIFNDPLPCDDPAGDALRLALAMRERMAGLCQRWRRLGHRLGFGVGISLGYATVGMVGSEGRYDYTASGTAVNLAARLCDEAEDGEILLSPRAYAAVEPDFPAESLGERSFKGIHAPVEVFRVTADGPPP